jgi:hypothetical protein
MSIYSKPITDLKTADLRELLDEDAVENICLEFKVQFPGKDETLKKLSSFANTYGGYLVIGAEADSKSGRLVRLPGVEPNRGWKQQVVQWCQTGCSPPVAPLTSDAIAVPGSAERVCYVAFVEESEETPHFLNSRKGAYVRTDELSARFEPQLATYEEIEHLANRRALATRRRQDLFERSRARFATYTSREYAHARGNTGTPGAMLTLAVVPRLPVRPLIELAQLQKVLLEVGVQRRRTAFPRIRDLITQHESAILLGPAGGWSLLDANIWGQLFYVVEIESERNGKPYLHAHSFVGELLAFLEHARIIFARYGFNGTLQFKVGLDGVLGKPWRYREAEWGSASRLDDFVEFDMTFPVQILSERRDEVARDLLRTVMFSLNWPDAARTIKSVLGWGYEYNNWGSS